MTLQRLFVDLNAYFASVEQQARPELRGKPIAVVPILSDSTSVIAASYEAKAMGVHGLMNVGEARRQCPALICVIGRHSLYIKYHHRILEAAETVLPIESVHSIDEFSMRLLRDERSRGNAEGLARRIKAAIRERAGDWLKCSIGIAPNRFLAKVASDMQKPDGLVVIEKSDLPHCLHRLRLTDLPGIGRRMNERLAATGIERVEQLTALSAAETERLWGSVVGRWWHHWLRGDDWGEIPTTKRSIGHQHVLPPEQRNPEDARAVCVRLLHKAAARARHMGYWAQRLSVHVKMIHGLSWHVHANFHETNDTLSLTQVFAKLWPQCPVGTPLRVGVTLEDVVAAKSATLPLFEEDQRRQRLASVVDRLNGKLGRDTVYLGSMLGARDSAPTRIAFKSIPDLTLPETSDTEDA